MRDRQGPMRKSSEIFVLQIARFGGDLKLGLHTDPEGAWIDHDVFLDRAEAEGAARVHESLPILNSAGDDITADVVTAARVITLAELELEFGPDRARLLTAMFQARFRALWLQLRESGAEGPAR